MKDEIQCAYGVLNGRIVHVNTVERGLACGCTCPSCGAPFIARHGAELAWHFAHASDSACSTAPETGLHKLAKQMIADAKRLMLPEIRIQVASGRTYPLSEPWIAEASAAHSERPCGDIKPDVTLEFDGAGSEMFVEVRVAHAVDEAKLQKIRDLKISCLEIDLRHVDRSITEEELAPLLLDGVALKTWKYNVLAESKREHYEEHDRLRIKLEKERRDAEERAYREKEEKRKREEELEAERLAESKRKKYAEYEEQLRLDRERAEARRIAEARQAEQLAEWKRGKDAAREEQRRLKRERDEAQRVAEEQERERQRVVMEAERERLRPQREAEAAERMRKWEAEAAAHAAEQAKIDAERARVRAIEEAQRKARREAEEAEKERRAEAKREKWRKYYLDLWTPADQVLYRRCIDVDKLDHTAACRVVTASRETTYDERLADADRRAREHHRT